MNTIISYTGIPGSSGEPPPPVKSQNIVLSNTGPDRLVNHKATKPAFIARLSSAGSETPFCWWADNGPFLVLYRSSVLPSSTKKNKQKQRCLSWTPMSKLSGLAHVLYLLHFLLNNYYIIITLVNVNAPVVATTSWWWHFYALVVA